MDLTGLTPFKQVSSDFCPLCKGRNIQGDFFNWPPPENVSRLAPPKMPRLAPPKSFKYENHIEILRHLDFFSIMGGAVWDSNVSVNTSNLANLGGGAS